MNLQGNELVSYSNNSLAVGSPTGDFTHYWNDYPDYWHDHYHYYPIYFPQYHLCEKSKVEQAFRIVTKLFENKIIEKEITSKELIKLINDIAEVI